jgi:hypothetical protein
VRPEPAPSDDALLDATLPTELGGVLYLIHLLADLDLPAVFEPQWRLASAVGGWGTLELVARVLLASTGSCSAAAESEADARWDDPVWALLADLDGRRLDQPPGGAYRCGAAFAAPPAWGPDAGAATPLAAAEPIPRPRHQVPLAPDLDRWLRAVHPWLVRRLRLAIDEAVTQDRAPDLAGLFAVRGWLTATATHVDLVLPLQEASIPISRAGLDRSPGWVPHLGRVVTFTFE